MKSMQSLQGTYSPLPQSISDTDSEKELSMDPVCINFSSNNNANNLQMGYRPNGHGLNLDEDVVKIKRGASKMSRPRKLAFLLSLVLCILPICIFLWVLPCSELHTCPVKILNWEYQLDGVELKGPIHLVDGVYRTNYNLAVLYKGNFKSTKPLNNGIISFMGLTGAIAWDFEQEVEPYRMNCQIIDTNNDGAFDCLIVDEKGLKAIETLSGQVLWHAHSSQETTLIANLGLPIAMPDLNSDGVNELISVFENTNLLVISGQSGQVLANIPVPTCTNITTISQVNSSVDYFTIKCSNLTGSEDTYKINFSEMEKCLIQPKNTLNLQKIENQTPNNIYVIGNRKLLIENRSTCPNCYASMKLLNDEDKILKTWIYNNAYIMHPKIFSFNSSKAKQIQLRGHLNGFIIKIWQWQNDPSKKFHPNQLHVNKRNIQESLFNATLRKLDLTERVVLLMFNDTNVHEINASYTEITQICHESDCQPNLNNQLDSLLVADIEYDSSTELVSFYSSYVMQDENNWQLTSYVKVLRLEEELPKLYGAK